MEYSDKPIFPSPFFLLLALFWAFSWLFAKICGCFCKKNSIHATANNSKDTSLEMVCSSLECFSLLFLNYTVFISFCLYVSLSLSFPPLWPPFHVYLIFKWTQSFCASFPLKLCLFSVRLLLKFFFLGERSSPTLPAKTCWKLRGKPKHSEKRNRHV